MQQKQNNGIQTVDEDETKEEEWSGAGGRWTERDPLPGGLQKSHLIVWAFEDFLKEQYFAILKILEVWCNVTVGEKCMLPIAI